MNIIRSAAFKLTLYYLGIIMALSLIFSVIVYNLATQELNNRLRRPAYTVFMDNDTRTFERFRQTFLRENSQKLQANLMLFNLFVLFAGGGLSYLLARRSLEPIEAAMEAQSRFTADASHELRTPLTAMQTEIEVALRNPKLTKDQAKVLLQSNLEEVERLRALSENLLRLARDGNQTLAKNIVSIDDIATEALNRIYKLAKAKHITITSKLAKLNIYGDPASLTELLVILLDNAIKYSPTKADVMLTAKHQGNHVIVQVEDHGQGIAPVDLPHIFDRFYRADTSRSARNESGHGLGLSIAKQIIELHDGTITAASKPGQGTTFVVKLPYVKTGS
jgi:signal transduction histidine kinase